MGTDTLVIHGAREHNLKNITLELPRNALVVFTGLSGSGKSSLAFDTIYAEGQRRYVESLSSYARQFLGQMEKPDVDFIEGLSPAISIDQKSTSRNPRSTVGTITEIYDYLRVLYARIGHPHCPKCGRPIGRQTPEQIVDQVMQLPEGTRFQVLAPVVRGRKGEYEKLLKDLAGQGFVRARIDGEVRELAEPIRLPRNYKHTIEVVVDRLVAKPDIRRRVADSVESALQLTEGLVAIAVQTHDGEDVQTYSQALACTFDGLSFDELQPRNFSFNSPYGACQTCDGLGVRLEVDAALVVPDPDLSIAEGALAPWSSGRVEYWDRVLDAVADSHGFSTKTPWKKLPKKVRDVVLYGSDEEIYVKYKNRYGRTRSYWTTYEGVVPVVERRHVETDSESQRERLEEFMREVPCRACGGARLRPETLAVTVGDLNISQLTSLSIRETLTFTREVRLSEREQMIAERLLKEIRERLQFLVDVGLDYLTLSRASATLAGGEAQRIRLATQIGSGLVGVLYILDEPSIGLHQRDNRRLIDTLVRLRDLGNTLIVVEHDEATIAASDHVVDIGPGAGAAGGEIVYTGDLKGLLECDASLTGAFLSGRRVIPTPRGPARAGLAAVEGARRARAQPQGHRPRDPARAPRVRDGGERLGQVHARAGGPAARADAEGLPLASPAGQASPARGVGADRQGDRHRPVADRAHAALEPRDVHGDVRPHPQAVQPGAGGARPRLPARPVLVQRSGRALRELRGGRPDQDRDALPAGRVRHLRGLQGAPVQPRDAGGESTSIARSPTSWR